ncbi:hypothetical protein GCK72_021834 [Caenorhabditis remanei]|uniref:Uncharacterized protein n=1 Tax=Caenorhabditis remanei TaxID=31234 RepID=A0A6A5GL54_CAERE|nr:hypothetical protein GCK72_021834 [Caenorhabditis remanei]KAF1755265.1 hypothetical protein GCK72_021834 [Caenorhabditis remanei]
MNEFMMYVGMAISMTVFAVFYLLYCREMGDDSFDKEALAAMAALDEAEKKKKGKNNKKDAKKQQKNSPDSPKDDKVQQQKPATLTVQTNLQSASPKVSPAPKPSPQAPQEQQVQKQLSPPQQAPQTTPKENVPKKKSPKPVNVKDLDQKKVLARLSSLADLDEAYVQWLSSQFRDTDVQKNGLTSEVKALQKRLSEASQKNDRLQKEKASLEIREKNEQTQRASLSSKVQTLQARESELFRQVQAANAQLQAKDADHTKDTQTLRSKAQQLETEVNNLKSASNRSAGQLRSAQQQAREIQGKLDEQARAHRLNLEASEAGSAKMKESITQLTDVVVMAEQRLESASNEIADQTDRIRRLAAENLKLKEEASKQEDTLNATRLALSNQAKHDNEKKDSEMEVLKEEKKVWLSEKEQMVEKYERLEELVKELNNDIAEFHACKRDQEKIVADLRAKDADRSEELLQTKEKFEKSQQQVNEARQMLAEVRAALDEEKARAVEIPLNTPAPVEEKEVFELKKTNVDLAAAPGTSSDDKVKELQEKNDELRQRNMSILEKVEATPNLLVSDRKRVVAELAKVTKKQFKNFNDEEAYYDYLVESVSAVEKALAEKIQAASGKASKSSKSAAAPYPAESGSSDEAAFLRKTIVDLRQQLEHIGELADKQYEQIAALQS